MSDLADELLDHARQLAEQAKHLADQGQRADLPLRRAISATYYALFHGLMAAITDTFVGETQRDEDLYNRVYRDPKHKDLKDRLKSLKSQNGPLLMKFDNNSEKTDFNRIIEFGSAFVELQDWRADADYSPGLLKISPDKVLAGITRAGDGLQALRATAPLMKKGLGALLLFK